MTPGLRDTARTSDIRTLALMLLGAAVRPGAAQTPLDTAVTVRGFFQPADSGRWLLIVPEPVSVSGQRIYQMTLAELDPQWSRLADHFVEVFGRVRVAQGASDRAMMTIQRLRELEPHGTSRRTARLSFSQAAILTLAAIPDRFAWRGRDGQPTGVQPLLMYTLYNHGESDLDFMLPNQEVLCAVVRPEHAGNGDQGWRTSLPAPSGAGNRMLIRLGGLFRRFISVPPDAAPVPGRYVARVGLCAIPDYSVEATFEVRNP
jgi:hypothetical protein